MEFLDFLIKKPIGTKHEADAPPPANSENVKPLMEAVLSKIERFLNSLGFERRGKTFNKQHADGIIQVINIQCGKYDRGLKYLFSGTRENYCGKFTINLGVVVEEIKELDGHENKGGFYQHYDCQIRTTLSHLILDKEYWWTLSNDPEETSVGVIGGLKSHGFKWLKSYEDREKICKNWGNKKGFSRRAKLDVALITLKSDKIKGKKLLREYYRKVSDKSPHKGYVERLAEKLEVKL